MIWIDEEMGCGMCGEIIEDEGRWRSMKKSVKGKGFKIVIER